LALPLPIFVGYNDAKQQKILGIPINGRVFIQGTGEKRMEEKKCIRCLDYLLDFAIWKDPVFLDTMAFEGCIDRSIGQALRGEIRKAIVEMEKAPHLGGKGPLVTV